MKKHTMNFNSSSCTSSSHGHALYDYGFSFNATSTYSHEYLLHSITSYHMEKDKAIFSTLNECKKKMCVGYDRSLSVVGFGEFQVDNGHFNDSLCLPSLSYNLLSVYQITHSGPTTFYQCLKSLIQVKVKQ
jgi:hypothetical protein